MNATIGIYDTHDLAVEAVFKLNEAGFHVNQLSIVGIANTEAVDEQMHITPKSPLKLEGLEAGTLIGATMGVLTGIGVIAIPGLGFLFGAGALVGAIAGLEFGLIGGGIATALETVGVKNVNAKKYHDALAQGKFLVVVHGNAADAKKAMSVLEEHGEHSDMDLH